jgi:hypothetical protein
MKRKIFFAIATGFFAVATVFNMNMIQAINAGEVSLDAIAVMAQAQKEDTSVNHFDCNCYPCTVAPRQRGMVLIKFYSEGSNCNSDGKCGYGFC